MSCNNYNDFDSQEMGEPVCSKLDMMAYSPSVNNNNIIVAINIINHIVIFVITIAMAYKCWILEFKKTAMHAHLCTLGFVCLMAEGMMVRYHGNPLFSNYQASSKTLIHSLLQFVGGSLGIGGTLQKYWGKEKHFKSIHAKLGLIACILCAINFVAGLWGLLLPQTLWTVSLFHGFLGLATFIIGMLAQVYGYETGFFGRNFTLKEKHLYTFFTIVVLVLSCIGPFKILVYKVMTLWQQEESSLL